MIPEALTYADVHILEITQKQELVWLLSLIIGAHLNNLCGPSKASKTSKNNLWGFVEAPGLDRHNEFVRHSLF